jgi:hypothetical protein
MMTRKIEMSEGEGEQVPSDHQVPPNQIATWTVIGIAIVGIASLVGLQSDHQPESTRDYPPRPQIDDTQAVMQPAPEVDDDYLPCRDCHADEDRETGPAGRELEYEHEDMELVHGNLWCLHCHDPEKPGKLRLADASRVEFEDSWKLCTQCHAKKLPEWRAGVHGKQTGHWRGTKEYRTCVVCHEPHSPVFESLHPKPRPNRPDEIVYRGPDAGVENHEDL